MSDRADLARGWLRKATSDLQAARLIAEAGESFDTACFHVQQAVEKGLKAVLAYADARFPRSMTWIAFTICAWPRSLSWHCPTAILGPSPSTRLQ